MTSPGWHKDCFFSPQGKDKINPSGDMIERKAERRPAAIQGAALLLLAGAATVLLFPPLVRPASSPQKQFTLDNGLRVFLLERNSVPLVNIVAGVNAGSKDETDETSGLIHLLEHYILFRGTDVRSGSEIARDIRSRGAVFNAHTGQDAAFFDLTLPAEHFLFGLKNQKEILFRMKIEEDGLNAEKEVIGEEIRQIEDDPFRLGQALVFQNLLAGHPYGRPIYGDPGCLADLTAGDIERFYKRLFVPNNTVLAIVGNLPVDEMEARVREVFADVPRGEDPPPPPEFARPPSKTVEIERELDISEAYLFVGVLGPDYNDPGQYAADVLTQILGQGIHPMMTVALKNSRRAGVNSAHLSYIALKRAGAFVAYITLEPSKISVAKRETITFLKGVRRENFSPQDVLIEDRAAAFDLLESAKNKIRFLGQKAWESGLGLASSMAAHMLLAGTESEIDYLERIATVTSGDLRKAAGASFNRDAFVIVSIVPRKK